MQGSPFQGISKLGSATGSGAGVSALPGIGSISSPMSPSSVTKERGEEFCSILGSAMGQVNTAMTTSKEITGALMTGRLDNLHEMSIAGAKSEIMMKLTTNITSKLAQATTQLFQMQI